ncbi:PQQ-binding-like beta-propeller repeat protein [bacterium]|nr:PQQ-binding-like beta-propeller repeat protein [bacterium]
MLRRTVLALLLLAGLAHAENWPMFRGPSGLGYTAEANLPTTWGGKDKTNVLWASPLTGEGHASPIVWEDRVFVSTVAWADSVEDRKKVIPTHHLLCWRATDGKRLWDTQIPPGQWLRDDFRSGPGGGYAAPTPATDGNLVFCAYGSSVIAAADFDGKIIWRNEIEPHSFDVTLGASPILYADTVILLCAMQNKKDSRIVAFEKATGKVKWETRLPTTGFAHSTPVVIRIGETDQMIVVASAMSRTSDGIQSFDPATGKRLWWCAGAGDAASPAYGAGILYADNGRGGPGVAVDPTGRGDVSKTHLKWMSRDAMGIVGSPIIVGEHIYRLRSGSVKCVLAATGKTVHSKGQDAKISDWASPIADPRGYIYFATAGNTVVVKAGPKFEIVAVNDLGDPNHASAAASKGRLFLVGTKSIHCIGAK